MSTIKAGRYATERRERENDLFARMGTGDPHAKYELFATQDRTVKYLARQYANGDSLLEEEMIDRSIEAFDNALVTYNRDKKMQFGNWFYWYAQTLFKTINRDRTEAPWNAKREEQAGSEGRVDGQFILTEEDEYEERPEFWLEETNQIARMLEQGFEPQEIRSALGLTDGQYRNHASIIREHLERSSEILLATD
jgi:hypothetical protein